MKFKKTKLTALAMSVLMAASTITSVTWAADLFTDGAPAEVAVEAPVEVVSDVEDAEAAIALADAAATVTVAPVDVKGLAGVTFYYDSAKAKMMVRFSVVNEKGEPTGSYTSDAVVKGANLNGGIKQKTCTEWERAIYSFTYEGFTVLSTQDGVTIDPSPINSDGDSLQSVNDVKGYIRTPGTEPDGHDVVKRTGICIIDEAGHEKTGKGVYYDECSVCHQMIPVGYDPMTDYSTLKPKDIFAAYKDHAAGEYVVTDTASGFSFDCEFYDIGEIEHNYDTQHPIIIYDREVINGVDQPYNTTTYARYATYKIEKSGQYSEFDDFAPYNCYMNNGEMVAYDYNPLDPEDAFYFVVVECKDCKTIKYWDRVNLKNIEGKVDGTYYEQVQGDGDNGNILGFFGKNRALQYKFSPFGGYEVWRDGSCISHDYTVPGIPDEYLSDPPEPIFEKCGRMGYYDVTEYVTDNKEPVSRERVPVESNHSWGPVELVVKDTPFIDGTTSTTEDGKLLPWSSLTTPNAEKSGGYVVVRDSNGNVTEVKSANCVTTAKYQLGRQCTICGKWEKEGAVKTAGPNKDVHNWGAWSTKTDPADDKYYDLGDGTHKRYTYKHRVCNYCGARDLKLDEEFVEAHNLAETKYDNEGEDETYVAPTCGKDGSYDVILRCKCGYEDKESRKTNKIPATDKHVFGDNPAELQIIGEIQVGGRTPGGDPGEVESSLPTHIVYAQVVRKCTICGEYDSNGIDNTPVNVGGDVIGTGLPAVGGTVIIDSKETGRTFSDYVPAKVDPSTKVPYPCSVGKITVNFTWEGKVDGKAARLTGSKTVPYYINTLAYQGARAHKADDVRIIDKVDATATEEGSYTRVVYCSVCHDEVSREKVTVAKLGSAPAVTAKAVDYNTVDISWDAVEGASEYNLYYKSADTKVTRWKLIRVVKGTSFTHTGLQTGARYRYTVRGVVDGVLGAYDKNGDVARPMPVAPVMKSVTAQGKKTVVSWSKVEGSTGYIVFRKTPTGSWTRVGTVKSKQTSWTDRKPVSGSTYKVRSYRTVKGVNYKSGYSDVK